MLQMIGLFPQGIGDLCIVCRSNMRICVIRYLITCLWMTDLL